MVQRLFNLEWEIQYLGFLDKVHVVSTKKYVMQTWKIGVISKKLV